MLDAALPARVAKFHPGQGEAVARRTVLRRMPDDLQLAALFEEAGPGRRQIPLNPADPNFTLWCSVISAASLDPVKDERSPIREEPPSWRWETWEEVAGRVALGNASMGPDGLDHGELAELRALIRSGVLLMSGRHLQHGDFRQRGRVGEVYTNCSVACSTFSGFYLLLNGSGVGRDYSDRMMAVDWTETPRVCVFVDPSHPDAPSLPKSMVATREKVEARAAGAPTLYHLVKDSREGWAEAVALIETIAWVRTTRGAHGFFGLPEEVLEDSFIVLMDFSAVREEGRPIMGMQGRPASGPGPLMGAIMNVVALRKQKMPHWLSTLTVDHLLAEVVLVGGARRAARIATKYWLDPGILDFIAVKEGGDKLWSANNSVAVDGAFYAYVHSGPSEDLTSRERADAAWAQRVFQAAARAGYEDRTGEPGFVNVHRFRSNIDVNSAEFEDLIEGQADAVTAVLDVGSAGKKMLTFQMLCCRSMPYQMIVNPCGEICIALWGGYCALADVALGMAESVEEAIRAAVVAARALVRTNLMPFLFQAEVNRTNRIGVSGTGFFEFALKLFGYGFRDLIDEERSQDFWDAIARISRAAKDEAASYSKVNGINPPHTDMTIKPSGTVSKLFGLTEGAHLPPMRRYLRWVQFRSDDPLVETYVASGYPVRSELKTYPGTTIVGFPTEMGIITLAESLGLADKVVTAPEATPAEQFRWLRLLEKYWIAGGRETDTGNQVSYTLKLDPNEVGLEEWVETLKTEMPTVKCCSILPVADASAYEYTPEQPITDEFYRSLVTRIDAASRQEEDVDFAHVDCAGGACPVDFQKE